MKNHKEIFEQIINSVSDLVIISDSDYNINFANNAVVDFLQMSKDDILSRKCYSLFGDGEKCCKHCLFLHCKENRKTFTQRLYLKRFGIWVEQTVCPILDKNGNVDCIIEYFKDITNIVLLEENALFIEKKYKSILETSLDLVVSVDINGIVVDCNDRVESFLGYTKDELIGEKVSKIIHKDDIIHIYKVIKTIFEKGLYHNNNYRMVKKNGDVIYVLVNSSCIYHQNNDKSHTLCAITDVTEQHKIEEELREMNEELEQFAYVASHDLQEPLRVIASYCQLISNNYREVIDEEGQKYLDYVVDATFRMKNLIKELLDFSLVGKENIPFEEIDLNEIVSEVVRDTHIKIEEINAKIKVKHSLPVIFGIRIRIRQLFYNLISNSLKFRNNKSLIIEIDCEETINSWSFEVKDSGIGIEKQYFERIFGVFKRLYSRDEYPGSGIGLALCKKIVEIHGGEIWVESEKDKGTTMYFTISKFNKL